MAQNTIGKWPALARRLNYPLGFVAIAQTNHQMLRETHYTERPGFSPQQMTQVVAPGAVNEANRIGTNLAEMGFNVRSAIVSDVVLPGHVKLPFDRHTGKILHLTDDGQPNWNAAKPALLKPVKASQPLYASLVGYPHYFHFFAHSVFPLLNACRRGDVREPLVLVHDAEAPAPQHETAKALQKILPGSSLHALRPGDRLDIKRLFWAYEMGSNPEWMPLEKASVDTLRDALIEHYGLAAAARGPDQPLYLSRGGAPIRRLLNEDSLLDRLQQKGFEPFIAAASNHADQVARFHRADTVIAVHGAGLTNLLFCRPGTRVVEIFPRNFVKSTFLHMSLKLGLNYVPVIGSDGDFKQSFEAPIDAVLKAAEAK